MKKLLIFTAIIGSFVLGFYFYFHHVGRVRPVVNEIFVVSADVPASFEGARVVQISDLLVRSENCLRLLENVVEEVRILKPEIIVFTGNLFLPEGIIFEAQVAQLLNELDASLSQVAVLGYFDLAHEELTSRVLREAGFHLLSNDSVQIFNQSPVDINVIGAHPLNDRQTSEYLLDLHVNDGRFNLLLTSLPTYSTASFGAAVNLQLSGHCLGEQDTTEYLVPCFQFYRDTYQFADRFMLHVSSGLARFHSVNGLFRQPSIDSFLLKNE